MGETGGLSDPTRLPAPTTSSLMRTWVMYPEQGSFVSLKVEDAERSQGLEPGHTALSRAEYPKCTDREAELKRWEAVGNGLHGEVSTTYS